MQNRFTSLPAWAAFSMLIMFVLSNWGWLHPLGLTEDTYKHLMDLILSVLIAFGIFNNPTDSEHY